MCFCILYLQPHLFKHLHVHDEMRQRYVKLDMCNACVRPSVREWEVEVEVEVELE